MKLKSFLPAVLILFINYLSNAQAPDWTRLLQVSTYPVQNINAVTADASNNSYFAAGISGTLRYNSVNYTSIGTRDLIVTKLSPGGTVQWVRHYDALAGGVITANSIRTDASGNAYVSGDFIGTATFGGSVLTSSASANAFIVKFDPSGNALWATSFLSTGSGNSRLAFDSGGNTFLINKTNKLIKFSSTGVQLWEQSFTNNTLQSVAVYGSNLYVGGALQGPTTFGTIPLTPLGGSNTGFIVRADLNGTFNNSFVVGGSTTDKGSSIADVAVDNAGNLIITGCYTSNLVLGTLSNSSPRLSGSNYLFLAKCNGNFLFEWMNCSNSFYNSSNNMFNYRVFIDEYGYICHYGNTGTNFVWDGVNIIDPDKQYFLYFNQFGDALNSENITNSNINTFFLTPSGDIVSGGSYNYDDSPDYGNFFISKYDSYMWNDWTSASSNSSSGTVQIYYIKHDEGGNTYIQARVLGNCNYFGTQLKTNVYMTVISKHDIAGNLLWLKKIKDKNTDLFGCSFTLDKDNNVLTAGFFTGELQVETQKLITSYENEGYVAKFNSDGILIWASRMSIGSTVNNAISLTSDNIGNVIVSGVRPPDTYLIKFNPSGIKMWTKIIPFASDYNSLVSSDGSNIYLTSEIHLEIHTELSPVIIDGVTLTQSASDGATALIKFNTDGVAQWGKLYGGVSGGTTPDGWACDIDNDPAGNTYLWGWCRNNAIFGTTVLTNPYPQLYSYYLTKLNSSGSVVWAKAVYEKKYGFNYGNMQDLDESGNIYVGGHFKDAIKIEGVEYTPVGINDNFTVKYTNDGVFEWIKKIPSNSTIINCLDIQEEDVLSISGRPGKDPALGTFPYELKGGSTGIVATLGILKYISVSSDTLFAASPANSTVNFTINSNVSWTLSSDMAWLVPDKTSGTGNSAITLTAQQNTSNTVRMAKITIFRDGKKQNTIVVYQYGIPISVFPYTQLFSTWPPSSWTMNDGTIPWESYNSSSAFVNFWDYDAPNYAVMKMPIFDFSSLSNPELNFDFSHKYYEGLDDKFVIAVTTDWKNWTLIWQKHGSELNSNDGAQNQSPGTFARLSINLADYAGESFVGIAFVGISGYGPNLYIDNVSVSDPVATAPDAVTDPASNILHTSATLNGTVNANSAATTITFQYGTTISYGNSINAAPVNAEGSSPVKVSASLTGLVTNTLYHYRVVAVNSKGTDYGSDITFTPAGCIRLNYVTENVPGTYTDLASGGAAITTSNFDDANSSPQEIGFTFNFNCQNFTQFVLNTNGYIKLGSTPPSNALFFSGNNTNDGILSSASQSDVNILAPFTHDLTAGVLQSEYRVSTTGSAPNRVCTIQFKNLSDKTTNQQFENINFQVKLYETSNIIEFVYGTWAPSVNASVAKSAECGIKGNSSSDDHLITVSKTSTASWATAVFQHYNYIGNALNFGNPANRPVPDAGRTFRFKQMRNTDAAVDQILTLTKFPIPIASPHVIKAVIKNTGLQDLADVTVTLNVTGANSFTSTKHTGIIYANSYSIVSFDAFSPSNLGTNTINVIIGNDEDNSNNSKNLVQNVNSNTFSYADDSPAANSYRYDYLLLTRFNLTGTKAITNIRVKLSNDPNNIGNKVYGVVLNSSGTLLGRSADLQITAGANSNYVNLPITDPPVITNSDFYVGMATTTPIGADYYPTSYQNESPTRSSTYYISYSMGGGPIYSFSGARFIVEVTAEDPIITGTEENTISINQLSGDINIYPNPAKDNLIIDMSEYDGGADCLIKIVNTNGVTVYESNIPSDRYELDISSWLVKGYYFVQIYDSNKVLKTVRKIVTQ